VGWQLGLSKCETAHSSQHRFLIPEGEKYTWGTGKSNHTGADMGQLRILGVGAKRRGQENGLAYAVRIQKNRTGDYQTGETHGGPADTN